MIVLGELSDLRRKFERRGEVPEKEPEKDADEKGIVNIIRKPAHHAIDERIEQKHVRAADQRPEEGKQRTNDSLNISGTFGIIPELDSHALDKD